MSRRPLTSLLLAIALLLGLSGCALIGGDDRLRMMVPNSPGGGYDVTARTAVKITETTGITGPVQVFNLSGNGGTVALTRLMHETGNPDLLMMMGLGVIGATVTSTIGLSGDRRDTDRPADRGAGGGHGAGGLAVHHHRCS